MIIENEKLNTYINEKEQELVNYQEKLQIMIEENEKLNDLLGTNIDSNDRLRIKEQEITNLGDLLSNKNLQIVEMQQQLDQALAQTAQGESYQQELEANVQNLLKENQLKATQLQQLKGDVDKLV